MSITLLNSRNEDALAEMALSGVQVDLVYADMMYDSLDFDWIRQLCKLLKLTGSMFVQTDYRSVAELKIYMDELFGKNYFVNWIIWPYDWGGRSKRRFARKHDDILWYSVTTDYKFYPERVAIPKKTLAKGFNPSGRTTKIPTDVWDDIGNFHTMSKERVKTADGKNIRWQKPLNLMERILLSTTDEGDTVLDPFLGSGSTAVSCLEHNRNFIGIEMNKEVFDIADVRVKSHKNYENTKLS